MSEKAGNCGNEGDDRPNALHQVSQQVTPDEETESAITQHTKDVLERTAIPRPHVSNLPFATENSSLTATILVAAPYFKNSNLDIASTGGLGIQGLSEQQKEFFDTVSYIITDAKSIKFHSRLELSDTTKKDFQVIGYIYRRNVPVPKLEASDFKFVKSRIKHGSFKVTDIEEKRKIRSLLPAALNFFVLNMKNKIKNEIRRAFYEQPTKNKIATAFLKFSFKHAIESVAGNREEAFENAHSSILKIRDTIGQNAVIGGFNEFLQQQLQELENNVNNFDSLFLLLVMASEVGDLNALKNFLIKISNDFATYLHHLIQKSFNPDCKNKFIIATIEKVAYSVGSDFYWLFFRINRHEERLQFFNPKNVSNSILGTLQRKPEVLLECQQTAERVVIYLVQSGRTRIDELYPQLIQVMKQQTSNKTQEFNTPFLLQKLLKHKPTELTIENLKYILNSNFLKEAFQKSRPNLQNEPSNQNQTSKFDESIRNIFKNKKLLNIVELACNIPDYLFEVAKPVVDDLILKQLQAPEIADNRNLLSAMENSSFGRFAQAKQRIENVLLERTKDYLKSGRFQKIGSVKLILLGLTQVEFWLENEDTNLPERLNLNLCLLKRPEIADLKEIMEKLPPKFIQNLHSALMEPNVTLEKTLKPYRKEKTKNVVDKLLNHFDQLDEILIKVNNLNISLTHITCLEVNIFIFFHFTFLLSVKVK